MRINPNIILLTIGVSFSIWFTASPVLHAQALYDSEGRELMFDGKKLIRKPLDKIKEEAKVEAAKEEASKIEAAKTEAARKEPTNPIIDYALKLKPELSTQPRQHYYRSSYPYSRHGYSHYNHYNHYGISNYYYSPYYGGCYNYRSIPTNNIYLNYTRGGFSIQTQF